MPIQKLRKQAKCFCEAYPDIEGLYDRALIRMQGGSLINFIKQIASEAGHDSPLVGWSKVPVENINRPVLKVLRNVFNLGKEVVVQQDEPEDDNDKETNEDSNDNKKEPMELEDDLGLDDDDGDDNSNPQEELEMLVEDLNGIVDYFDETIGDMEAKIKSSVESAVQDAIKDLLAKQQQTQIPITSTSSVPGNRFVKR